MQPAKMQPRFGRDSAETRPRHKTSRYQHRLRIGRVQVKLIEAANLPAADLGGKSDPFARLILTGHNKYEEEWAPAHLGGLRQEVQSKVVKKTLNPGWYEDHAFAVPRHDAKLLVQIFDKDDQSGRRRSFLDARLETWP